MTKAKGEAKSAESRQEHSTRTGVVVCAKILGAFFFVAVRMFACLTVGVRGN
jgi:hypothetical protein